MRSNWTSKVNNLTDVYQIVLGALQTCSERVAPRSWGEFRAEGQELANWAEQNPILARIRRIGRQRLLQFPDSQCSYAPCRLPVNIAMLRLI